MTPAVASIIFSAGLSILLFYFSPQPFSDVFAAKVKGRSLKEKVQRNLRLAGLFDQTPTVIIVATLVMIVLSGFLIGVIVGSPIAALAAIPLVPGVGHFILMQRQRQFMVRASDEIIPFLNKMATSVKAGRPAAAAYVQAVQESRELRSILSDSAAKVTAGASFTDSLVETIDVLPLRMWSVFVRQVEAFSQSGGDLSSGLEKTVTQINMILQLNAEARADYANQARQQRLIVIVALGGVIMMATVVSPEVIRTLWTTTAGLVVDVLAFGVMGFGLWFSRKQLRDIQRKLNF